MIIMEDGIKKLDQTKRDIWLRYIVYEQLQQTENGTNHEIASALNELLEDKRKRDNIEIEQIKMELDQKNRHTEEKEYNRRIAESQQREEEIFDEIEKMLPEKRIATAKNHLYVSEKASILWEKEGWYGHYHEMQYFFDAAERYREYIGNETYEKIWREAAEKAKKDVEKV